MTVAESFHDRPFAMLNWHRNWCEKQNQKQFCFSEGALAGEFKNDWKNCPNRSLCFIGFINSDASAAHNRVARAVRDAEESEVSDGK